MKVTELEIEVVKVQTKLFADFRAQFEDQAARYCDQGKSKNLCLDSG